MQSQESSASVSPASVIEPPKGGGLMRLVKATGYSLEGLAACFRLEAAFRQECLLAGMLIPVALFAPFGLGEKLFLVSSVLLLLIVELLNSAVEWTVDLASAQRHPFGKRAKDMGSAAVLLALINLGAVWGLILWNQPWLHDWLGKFIG